MASCARSAPTSSHAAGSVRMNLPFEQVRHGSVDSARHILELAEECKKIRQGVKVEFVSTVGVAGRRPGVLPESWITEPRAFQNEPRAFHNTYEQAKAEAEAEAGWLVRQAVEEQGLPVTVHRPNMMVEDSRTGKIIHF